MFRKPRRQIRLRTCNAGSDEDAAGSDRDDITVLSDLDEEQSVADSEATQAPPPGKLKKTKKSVKEKVILSFADADDEGEVFQVRKSSQSRRLARQTEREKRQRQRTSNNNNHTAVTTVATSGGAATHKIIVQPPPPPVITAASQLSSAAPSRRGDSPRILSGLEAVYADYDSGGSDEANEDPPTSQQQQQQEQRRHQSKQPDNIRLALKDGVIPDAAMIHAVRKKREQARRTQSAVPDYIPVNNDTASASGCYSQIGHGDDSGPEEEAGRLDLAVNAAAADKLARRHKFNTARHQDECSQNESQDHSENLFWEDQQLKKAFAGAQKSGVSTDGLLLLPSRATASSSGVDADEFVSSSALSAASTGSHSLLPRRRHRCLAELAPHLVRQRLTDKVSELRAAVSDLLQRRDRAVDELVAGEDQVQRLTDTAPATHRRHRYFQHVRAYLTDLTECFNEKLEAIELAEERMTAALQSHCRYIVERRRLDVQDQRRQLDITASTTGGGGGRVLNDDRRVHSSELTEAEVEARRRRTAEREGRRTRRRRARELAADSCSSSPGGGDGLAGGQRKQRQHCDGLSSDDETPQQVNITLASAKKSVMAELASVFEDVNDEFCSLRAVLRRFVEWRRLDRQSYCAAFVSLSLASVVLPLVRHASIVWDPLNDPNAGELERITWFRELVLFDSGGDHANEDDMDETSATAALTNDPDRHLASQVVQRVLLPRLDTLLRRAFDPLSRSQSARAAALVRRLAVDVPTLTTAGCCRQLRQLLAGVRQVFAECVRRDVYLPSYPQPPSWSKRQRGTSSSEAVVFYQRQLHSAVKLLGNMLCWTGVLTDSCLQQLCVHQLLNGKLLMSLTQLPDPADAVAKCTLICSVLPSVWCSESDGGRLFAMFISYLSMLAAQISNNNGALNLLRDIGAVLKTLGASDALAKVEALMKKRLVKSI